jgi:hypothetical protein
MFARPVGEASCTSGRLSTSTCGGMTLYGSEMQGYSGTTLAKKLGIKPNSELAVFNVPEAYDELFKPMPEGVRMVREITHKTDVIHIFSSKRVDLISLLESSLEKMNPDAIIWVSWPKKSSRVQTDITEDTIRGIALPMGLVDIKVCAIDETWSGLKLVIRRKNRIKHPWGG